MPNRTLLSRQLIEKARARPQPYRLWDTKVPGLFLRVQPSGAKTFNVQWSRTTSRSLGKYPVLTLEGARTRALAIMSDAAENGTPAIAKRAQMATTLRTFLSERYAPWFNAEHKNGQRNIDAIESQFANLLERPLSDLTAWAIEKYKSTRLKDGISPATVNRDVIRIKALVAKAVEWKFLAENPLKTVKRAKGEADIVVRYLSDAEERALRKALGEREKAARIRRLSGNAWRTERGRDTLPALAGYSDHLQPMVLLSLNTGLRRGELTSLQWSDVDLKRKVLTVRSGYAKSGKARHVPLNAEAVEVLKQYRKQHDEMLARAKAKPRAERHEDGEDRIFAVHSVKKAWGLLLTKAKIGGFRWHDLRHSFASRLVMQSVDLNTVRELLGHSDLAMTLRYAHLAPEHKAAAVEKLVR